MPAMALDKINVDSLRPDVRGAVRTFAERLARDVGDNITSLCVVGSALTADFSPRRSDINTVLVVERGTHTLLKILAAYGSEMGRLRLRAPWLMTTEYLQDSRDVFGVEFLDFQLTHTVICGRDPFDGLQFNKECVRLQCERELRSAEIQLWQGYLRGMGHHKEVRPLLLACVGKLLPLLRAMLWLVDAERPREAPATLEQAGTRFGLEAKAVGALLMLRRQDEDQGPEATDLMFQDVHRAVKHLCRQADGLKTA